MLKYEVVHRPGKSIGHADGLSRTPPPSTEHRVDAIESCKLTEAYDKDKTETEWPKRMLETQFLEKEGNLLNSDEVIAYCFSVDLKMTERVARKKTAIHNEKT